MSNVDESVDESKSSSENPIVSDEPNEDENEHDLFKFLNDDDIPFSRLLLHSTIWQVQGSNNGDANPNMPIHHDFVQM
jgi:hypothetical protein